MKGAIDRPGPDSVRAEAAGGDPGSALPAGQKQHYDASRQVHPVLTLAIWPQGEERAPAHGQGWHFHMLHMLLHFRLPAF